MEGTVHAAGPAQLKRGESCRLRVPSGFAAGSGTALEDFQSTSGASHAVPPWLGHASFRKSRRKAPCVRNMLQSGSVMCSRAVKGTRFPAPMGTESSSRAPLFPGRRQMVWPSVPVSDCGDSVTCPIVRRRSQKPGRQKACPLVALVACPVLDAGHAPILPF
jgi:hypothetical protein